MYRCGATLKRKKSLVSNDCLTNTKSEIYNIAQKTKKYKKYNTALGDVFATGMVLLKMVSPFRKSQATFGAFWHEIVESEGSQQEVITYLRGYNWDVDIYPRLTELLSRVLCAESAGRITMAEFSNQLAQTEPFMGC